MTKINQIRYGVPRGADGNYDIKMARGFDAEHWNRMLRGMKRDNPSWIEFPKYKVFISFHEPDRSYMDRLKKRLEKSALLKPVIVEDERQGALNLSKLVKSGINDCKFFIPILSQSSIYSQWVNQEIGYAESKRKCEIVPIVEESTIDGLKGFIHKQRQLAYSFSKHESVKKSRLEYRRCMDGVIHYMEDIVRPDNKGTKSISIIR